MFRRHDVCKHYLLLLGLEEEGLYRISGATSDIQKLKKTFEKSQSFDHRVRASRTGLIAVNENYNEILKTETKLELDARHSLSVAHPLIRPVNYC